MWPLPELAPQQRQELQRNVVRNKPGNWPSIFLRDILPQWQGALQDYFSGLLPQPPTSGEIVSPIPPMRAPVRVGGGEQLPPVTSLPSVETTPGLARRVAPRLSPEKAREWGVNSWWEPTGDQGLRLSPEELRVLLAKYFQPQDVSFAEGLVPLESGRRPNAFNTSSGAMGLFQFMPSESKRRALNEYFGRDIYESGDIYDPDVNVRAAAALLYGLLNKQSPGWQNWEASQLVPGRRWDNGEILQVGW